MKRSRNISTSGNLIVELTVMVAGPMLTTALLYLLFRGDDLFYYKLASYIDLHPAIQMMRTVLSADKLHPDYWVKFSLPGALWLLAFQSLMFIIWNKSVNRKNVFWILTPLAVAVGGELAQLFHITDGTFDILDVIFYILGFLIAFGLYSLRSNYNLTIFNSDKRKHYLSFISIIFFSAIVVLADVI